jgi:sRNA-binding regulator protein Hfq
MAIVVETVRGGKTTGSRSIPPKGRKPMKPPKKTAPSAESKFFESLMNRPVVLHMLDGSQQSGTLVWSDRYTLGMQIGTRDVCVYKQAIQTIEVAS